MSKYKFWIILALLLPVIGLFSPQTSYAQESEAAFEFVDEFTIRATSGDARYIKNSDANPPGYYLNGDTDCTSHILLDFSALDRESGQVQGTWRTPISSGGGCTYSESSILIGNFSASGISESEVGVIGEETCESLAYNEGFSFGWLFCGVMNAVGGAIEGIFNWILGYNEDGVPEYCNLVVNLGEPSVVTSGESSCDSFNTVSVRDTWNAFRNLANVFFVIAFLYAIYQVAFSNGNNAFLIRSMLPKLAAAAVLVQLSYFLASIVVSVANDLGSYVVTLFDWVFRNDPNFDVGTILFGGGDNSSSFIEFILGSSFILIGVFAAYSSLVTILASIALMLVIVFLVLIARKLLILVALVLAPLAAIAWIHPETDGFAKAWWNIFSKLLLMYPIIILLIKSGELMARATTDTDGDVAFDIVRFVAFFIPFFLIPFTFKFAGGLIGQVAGIADNARKGFVDRAKGVDEQRRSYRREKAAAQYKENQLQGKKTGVFTRARAGMLGSSIFYGRQGGKLYRAEKSSEAYDPQDKINLLNLKAEKQAGEIADYKLQQEVAAWSTTMKQDQIKSTLAQRAMDPNRTPIEKDAVMRQLVTLRAVPQLETVFENAASMGPDVRARIDKFKNENFGTIDSFAAHLTRGGFDKDNDTGEMKFMPGYGAYGELNPEQLAGQNPHGIRKAIDWATREGKQDVIDKIATNYTNTAPYQRNAETVSILSQVANKNTVDLPVTDEWGVQKRDGNDKKITRTTRNVPMSSDVATRVKSELGSSLAGAASTSESIASSTPNFEQRKQQIITIAQQRNIPITDERSITPETVSSFETMYNIEPPVQSGSQSTIQSPSTPSTPEEQARRTFGPRTPYAGGRTSPGEHSSDEPINPASPFSGGGRHLQADQNERPGTTEPTNQENNENAE